MKHYFLRNVFKRTLLKHLISGVLLAVAGGQFANAAEFPAINAYKLTSGWHMQFDAGIDSAGRIHLIADKYYQFDTEGRQRAAETQAQDLQGGLLSYPPALSIDANDNVHILTRGQGASLNAGFDILYRVRKADGTWMTDRNYRLSGPERRNYVIGIAAFSETEAYAQTSIAGANVWGDIRFWEAQQQAPRFLGNWSGIWRADLDTRMRGFNNKVYFASANAFVSDDIHFSIAERGPNLLADLQRNVQRHNRGSNVDKKGGPDISVDQTGAAHLTYGAYQEVYYNQYNADGSKVYKKDQRILDGMGKWHLNFGLAAVGASEDGSKVLVAGLKTTGDKEARYSNIVLTYSLDSGKSWSEPIETGQLSHGGEGRLRPRILSYKDQFFILYYDPQNFGISMASIDMSGLENRNPAPAVSVITQMLLN